VLEIKNLTVSVEGKPILNSLSLEVRPGEIHAIMGPNGAGKSTLSKIIAGHPSYEVEGGDIFVDGESILEMEPEERAQLGLFVSFQYPPEIPGVSNFTFLYTAYCALKKAKKETVPSEADFRKLLSEKLALIDMKESFLERNINEDFSGGEKKRNEILQMAVLDPVFSILDETDSGLDIDALKSVAEGVKSLMTPKKAIVLITHYQRLLNYIKPDFVHVLIEGRLVKSGGADLAMKLEKEGYEWIIKAISKEEHV
jgi:Fe-S cluster assembly ATP-binding protein